MDNKEAECYLEFWESFVQSLNKCGGRNDIMGWKNMTLFDLSLVLAPNGIRFYYDKNGVLK